MIPNANDFRSAGELLVSEDWDQRIQCAATVLKRRPIFRELDREDVVQELRLGILTRIGDEPLSAAYVEPYFRRALFCTAASMARAAEAQCRRFDRGVSSLNTVVLRDDGSCVEVHDCVAAPADGDIALKVDIRDLLAQPCVSERDRAVAEGLRDSNRSQVAKHLGLPRATTHENVKRLRRVLEPLDPRAAAFRRDRVIREVGDCIDAHREAYTDGH